jgi:hypothetical protein
MTIARLSPRIALIRRVGIAQMTAAQECGLPIGPGDLELISESKLRAICAGCHRDLFQISRTVRNRIPSRRAIPANQKVRAE